MPRRAQPPALLERLAGRERRLRMPSRAAASLGRRHTGPVEAEHGLVVAVQDRRAPDEGMRPARPEQPAAGRPSAAAVSPASMASVRSHGATAPGLAQERLELARRRWPPRRRRRRPGCRGAPGAGSGPRPGARRAGWRPGRRGGPGASWRRSTSHWVRARPVPTAVSTTDPVAVDRLHQGGRDGAAPGHQDEDDPGERGRRDRRPGGPRRRRRAGRRRARPRPAGR